VSCTAHTTDHTRWYGPVVSWTSLMPEHGTLSRVMMQMG